MPDKPFLVPYRARPRIYPALSSYLQTIAPYAPPLDPASLPGKITAAKTAAAKAAAVQQEKEQTEKEDEKKDEATKEKTWIEIVLVGDDDKPIKTSERYVITLPDGKKREGTLRDGKVKLSELEFDAGAACKLTFPDLDKEAWEPA